MFQNNCWTEVTFGNCSMKPEYSGAWSTSILQLYAAVAQPWHDRSDEWVHAAMLNTGGASCIRHCWCSTKHRHGRGCAQWAFGHADSRMPRRFEIICFTNNSNPHAFLFLSDQLGHILEKEEEFSLGRQKCSVWWHDTSYRPRTFFLWGGVRTWEQIYMQVSYFCTYVPVESLILVVPAAKSSIWG